VALLDPLALPALRAMLELAEFERALERPPWTGEL